jgi:uncharacterized coiled-coil protein SlyX
MDQEPKDSAGSRFMRLEVKAAYLEKLAMDLDEVVIRQGHLIEDLERRVLQLERQLQASAEGRELGHERPPHY